MVVLVADKNMKAAVSGILLDPARIRMREIEILGPFHHPKNDPGGLPAKLTNFSGRSYARLPARSFCLIVMDVVTHARENSWN